MGTGAIITMKKSKIIILYHSGAGSTRVICEIYQEVLNEYEVDLQAIRMISNYKALEKYDFIIFAFPTYHCSPSKSMLQFIANMPSFHQPKRAFVFTTCGLYSGNSLRKFINEITKKNIVSTGYAVYRSPATDAALLLPAMPFYYTYEKKLAVKIKEDIKRIEDSLNDETISQKRPKCSLLAVVNYPNEILGKLYKHKLKINDECVACNNCVNICERKCWVSDSKYPIYHGENCEFCFRCIHHCPKGAIVISKRTKNKQKLNTSFYNNLKQQIMNELSE